MEFSWNTGHRTEKWPVTGFESSVNCCSRQADNENSDFEAASFRYVSDLSDSECIGSFTKDPTWFKLSICEAYSQNYGHGRKKYLNAQFWIHHIFVLT